MTAIKILCSLLMFVYFAYVARVNLRLAEDIANDPSFEKDDITIWRTSIFGALACAAVSLLHLLLATALVVEVLGE